MSIHDIAKRAGVSIATVSYALNNKKNVSKEKREQIIRIAEEMNYVPNSLAKALQTKKTNIVGLIVPDLSVPYTLAMIRHLEYYARKNDLYLLLGHTDGNTNTLRSIVDSFIKKNVDALILASGLALNQEENMQKVISRIQKFKIPLVIMSPLQSLHSHKTNFVIPDLEDGAYQITRYLLDNGMRKMIYFGGHASDYLTEIRHWGFERALKEMNMPIGPDLFQVCGYTFHEGYQAINRFLEDGHLLPEAIVTINDTVALGIYKGLKEQGIRVPDDISLVGYDDIEQLTLDFIPLTTVKVPVDEMSKLCIEGLMKCREGNNLTFQYSLKPQIVIRESVQVHR